MTPSPRRILVTALCASMPWIMGVGISGADQSERAVGKGGRAADGPRRQGKRTPHRKGNVKAGQEVFRFETFGNEGFWTDAMKLPQGMTAAKFTPVMALKAGLQVDIDALDPATKAALGAELKTDLSPGKAPMLHDPKTTMKLLNANAVIGVVVKDSNGNGTLDAAAGDKVGIACAICHTVTDNSVFSMPNGGSIGKRIDGLANLALDMGALLATAANSRAYYPNLQLELGGSTRGRAPKGLTESSSEADVDAYLKNREFYPVGTFDETSDGIGNPVKNTPLFRTDLAAPWSTSASFDKLDDIGNGSYTTNLDLTNWLSPEGRKFLAVRGGAAGEEIATDYAAVLKETGVTGFPFVRAKGTHKADRGSPSGQRVDDKKLADMNAYLDSLPAPKGVQGDPQATAQGKELFRTQCTGCHNTDQSRPVPANIIPLAEVWPGYRPVEIAARKAPQTAIQDAPGTFDDKMIVIDASDRKGDIRGVALPLLLDLARTTLFLHNASVTTLDDLLDPKRGADAPHPFFVAEPPRRAALVVFLKSLDAAP